MATDLPPLTARQQSVLDYIQRTTGDRGFPPSYREIGEGVGLSSAASVAHQVKELERKGHLHRAPNLARATFLAKDDAEAAKTHPEIRGVGRTAWRDGYEFALRNLHDEAVQADLARLARDTA
ncbi:hypothetical protein [Streptomonospora arabica]|uniref:LexA repressor DNA-binding domain-containing protein n=1 Tax=Streptomonospora arabica TaxID=412417 RepID=A0ABV9SSI5_9ACTN